MLSIRISADYRGKPGALRDLRLDVEAGEIVGLVGQSGSGKSTLALATIGLAGTRGATVHGEILFRGRNLLALGERGWRAIRGREIALVPQSAVSALNPALRIGAALGEAWRAHARFGTDARERIAEALVSLDLPPDKAFLRRYPRQISVGQAQRVLIAMAVLHRPALVVADEPTSALDPITQADTLELFARLNRDLGTAVLYVSHDLLSVARLCHRVAILHAGQVVESAPARELLAGARHPYTQRLLAAVPALAAV